MKRPVILYVLATCVLFANVQLTPVLGQSKKAPAPRPTTAKISIVSPKDDSRYPGKVKLRYYVTDPDITSVTITVKSGAKSDSATAGLSDARVFLFSGTNTIELVGNKGGEADTSARAAVTIKCDDECIDDMRPPGGMVQSTAVAAPTLAPAATPAATATPAPAAAAKGIDMRLLDSEPAKAPTVQPLVLVNETSGIKRLVFTVFNDGRAIDSADVTKIEYHDGLAVVRPTLKIAAGPNNVQASDPQHFLEPAYTAKLDVKCEGDKCAAAEETAATGNKPGATSKEEDPDIKILKPDPDKTATVPPSGAPVYLSVHSDLKTLKYEVRNGDIRSPITTVDIKEQAAAATTNKPTKTTKGVVKANATPEPTSSPSPTPTQGTDTKGKDNKKPRTDLPPITVGVIKGKNTISFFNPDKPKERAEVDVECKDDNCALDFNIAKFPSSSMNSRVIVGMEQAGGSSAPSETHPVLDLFFLTPFLYDRLQNCDALRDDLREPCRSKNIGRRLLPRFGFWGDIRLAATPEQIAAAQVFPTSVVNSVTQADKSVDLVQSFDFLAGVEGQILSANGSFLSLIPGKLQKSSLYFAFGAGAISPLTATKSGIQIFNIPKEGDPRRDLFIDRFGAIPDGKDFIAISPIDRDRFLHQWYAGVRLKTYYCDNPGCTKFQNSFPSIVDFMFGQNEAVTGGSRHRGGIPDPKDPNKLINQKNSFVLRIDGFYPLPIKDRSFLFLYGTAIMKVGGGGVRVSTPLFLDNPGTTIQISDPKVFIPPTSILKLQQPDRDYYKIGIGVNLTDLFNRNKPKTD